MQPRKLEIGSENRPTEGYEHLDLIDYPHVEIVADAREIPIGDNTYEEVYSLWVLEHFAEYEIVDVLKEWRRILKPEGKIRIITGNQKSINQCLTENQITFKDWIRLTFGMKEEVNPRTIRVDACHKSAFDPDSIGQYFIDAGFRNLKVEATWGCEKGDDGKIGCPGIIIEGVK